MSRVTPRSLALDRQRKLPPETHSAHRRQPTMRRPMLSAARARRVEGNAFLACGDIKTLSMWNAPSDRDYYDPFGAYCDEHEAEVCVDCGAGGIQERLARIGAKSIGQCRNRYRPVAWRSQSKRSGPTIFRGWVTFRVASQADAHSRTADRGVYSARPGCWSYPVESRRAVAGAGKLLNSTGRPWDALDVRPHDKGSGG